MAVTFGRSPRVRLLGFGLAASALLVSRVWDSWNVHTRGMILAAYGVTVLGVGLIPELRTRGLLKDGTATSGTVVGAEEERTGGDPPSTTYHPVVQFTTTDGRTVTFTSGVGFGRQPKIGGAVPVRYRQDAPNQATIDRAYSWLLPAAFWLVIGLGLLVAAVVAYTEKPQVVPAAVDTLEDPGTGTVEPVPEPELPPPPATVAAGRIGDKLTVADRSGKAQFEVTVTRLKFTSGAQGDQPEHGLYMGVHVRARALSDTHEVANIDALVGGRTYEQAPILSQPLFDPPLNHYLVSLGKGQRDAGWLVFDVPARHGRLVLRNLWSHKVAVWTY